MRTVILALLLFLAGAASGHAKCADDLATFKLRIDAEKRRSPTPQPTPQVAAAAKEAQKADLALSTGAELDCFNAVARGWKELKAVAPAAKK
jgi:hypothetical protein